MSDQEGLTAYIAAFVAELTKTGVKDVVKIGRASCGERV